MDANTIALLRANAAAPTNRGGSVKYVNGRYVLDKGKPKGRGGFLSSLISEGSAAGGAAGGAAVGASVGSVVPVLGTAIGGVLGAGIGGFLGGTAGRGVENKVRDDQNFLGAGGSAKSALGEGVLSGVLGGVGTGVSAFRGIKAAGGVNELRAITNSSDDLTKAILKGGKKTGKVIANGGESLNALQKSGRGIATNAMGIGQGAKASGIDNLGAQQSDELLKTLTQKLGLKRGNPEQVQRALEPIMKKTGAELADIYAKSGVKITSEQTSPVLDRILNRIIKDPSINLNKRGENELIRQLQLLGNKRSPSEVWEFQKLLGNSINFGKNTSAKLVDREAVARIIREETGALLDDVVKEAVDTRAIYSNAKTADTLLRTASKQADKSGVVARVMTSAPVRKAEAKLGGMIEGGGNLAAGANTGLPMRLAKGTAVRGLANNMIFPQDQGQPVEQNQYQDVGGVGMLSSEGLFGNGALSGAATGGAETPQQYGLEQALSDAYGLLGPNESPSSYLQYAKALMDQKGQSNGPDTTKVTAQQYSLAQRGQQALQQMTQLLQENPDVLNRTATPGRKLPIVGGFISNAAGTGDFDAIGYNIASSLLRIETGAQANESEIRNLQSQMIPRAGDSEETVARKIQQLNQAFSVIINAANGNQSSGNLSDAMTQLQGAY